jgi:cellulose synthase/poly-beta-1,6-N-acetylglucosamine synthase-like glycosyltransferase
MSYIDIFWWILYFVDILLFALVTITVAYMVFFSVSALFSKIHEIPKAKSQNRFIILIPAYKSDNSILQTVTSILSQNYPQRMFDVVVISDHQSEMTNMRLAQYTITLLTPNFEKSSKTKSLQYAILNLPEFKIYDVAIVLNADNIVETDFLEQMNDAYETAGTKAIVSHLLPRNRDTSSARLSTVFEEINNSIFRRGHIAVGLSSALMSSGVAYEFDWFKNNIMKVRANAEDKELEAMLIRQHVYIDYFDQIYVFNERKREVQDFNRQRFRWISDQVRSFIKNVRFLPVAIFNKHYDTADKIIQWMLLPRSIMFAIIFVMCITLPFIYLSIAIKWWVVGAIWGFSLTLAVPNDLVDKNWDKDFIILPLTTAHDILKSFTQKIRSIRKK